MIVYTDPSLLDVAGAMEELSELGLSRAGMPAGEWASDPQAHG